MLEIWEEVLGPAPKHPDVAQGLNNLAWLYADKGKYDEAEEYFRQALAIREKVFGTEHSDVAESLNDLASLYYKQGKYAEAEECFQRALTLGEKALGQGNPDTVLIMKNYDL